MQFQLVHSSQYIVAFPAFGGAIAAGGQQPMQDRQKNGPLDGKLKTAAAEDGVQDRLAAGLLPEFFEDQRRAPVARADDREMLLLMLGQD